MGCFSVSCTLSGLPIYDHEIYAMVIRPKQFGDKTTIYKQMFLSDFVPASPLISGNCDAYGNIEDIQDDDVGFQYTCKELLNIEATEESFHKWVENPWMEEVDDLHITYFRKEIVDRVIPYLYKNDHSLLHCSHQNWILELFPEIFIKCEETAEERYKYHYKVNGKTIKSDGKWIHGGDNFGFYETKKLLEFIGSEEISNYIMNSEKLKNFLKTSSVELEMLGMKKRDVEYSERLGDVFQSLYYSNYYDYNIVPFKLDDVIIKKLAESIMLSHFMYSCNRPLLPTFSGPQYNELKQLSFLSKITRKTLLKDFLERRN